MLVISKTPLRISFFGGGTDYRNYYLRKRGAVLGTTINQYTHVSVMPLKSAFFNHRYRISYSRTELTKDIHEIEHPSIRECLKHHKINRDLEINIFSDLPAKTGLGSSSSFTVGFLNALYALQGKTVSKQRLAEEACFVEQELIRENVGSQDQFHAAFGGLNIIEFDAHKIKIRPVIITKDKKALFESHLLIFYTGLTRHASEIVKEQIEKTEEKSNDEFLERMLEAVYLAEEIIASYEGIEMVKKLGELLDESWHLKKNLSSKITNPLIDKAYEDAKRAGAYGGKLCGAGSGGFLAILAPKECHHKIRVALQQFAEVNFQFENEGSTIIYLKD